MFYRHAFPDDEKEGDQNEDTADRKWQRLLCECCCRHGGKVRARGRQNAADGGVGHEGKNQERHDRAQIAAGRQDEQPRTASAGQGHADTEHRAAQQSTAPKEGRRQHHGLGEIEPAGPDQRLHDDQRHDHGGQEAAQAGGVGSRERVFDGTSQAEARPARERAEGNADSKGGERHLAVGIQCHRPRA